MRLTLIYAAIAAALVLLAGCAAKGPDWKAMDREADYAQERCWARWRLGRLHNFSEAIDCATPEVLAIHRRYGFPHMDLVEMFRARWRAIAERFDLKEISDAEYRAQYAELNSRFISDQITRNAATAAQNTPPRMMQPIVCQPTGFSVVCY